MKNNRPESVSLFRRFTAFLTLVAFAFAVLPAARAENTRIIHTSDGIGGLLSEEPSEDEKLASEFLELFGLDVEVEVDGDGQILSVNGYPFRSVATSFNIRSVEDKFSTEAIWVDYPFWQPAEQYNGSLANMSLIMALCSARDRIRDADPESFDPARDVEEYLLNAGFTDIRKDDYSKETSIYTISTAIGSRRMEHEGEEPFTLIAVGVCGGGYQNEWQSNITVGTEDLHEGFRSASDLVIDRIAGYIATRGIRGRVKIWISGFSRAAAVANLTAGRLAQAGAFPREDIFAYTFATPAAVLNPPEAVDGNIFNILSPTDVVPQVMPAEWGYGRYGKDLWIPVQEFSSIGEALVQEREKVVSESFGIEVHYSAALNLRMRLLVSMVLEAIGGRENYARNIQDTLVGILQQHSASNLLATLRSLLVSVKGSGAETRAMLDELLNYVFRVFGNALTRTELAAVNRNAGNAMYLLFTEHREDTYLANMGVIRIGLFEEDTSFTYVMVKGPVNLKLEMEELPGWSMELSEDGTVLVRFPGDSWPEKNPAYPDYYMERLGDVSVAAIPRDAGVRVRWEAVSGGTVEVRQVCCGVHASARYSGAASDPVKVSAGDSGAAYLPEQAGGALPEGFRGASWRAADLTGYLGISVPFVSWRIFSAVLLLFFGLLVFLVIRIVFLFLPNKGKKGAAFWILLAVFCVAAAEAEGSFWLLADLPPVLFAWRGIAGAAVLALFFLQRGKADRMRGSVLPGLAVLIAADLLMAWSFRPGAALFLLGHAVLAVSFLRRKPLNRAQWIQWGVLSLIAAGLTVFAFVPGTGMKAWAAAACAPVLLLLVYSVSDQAHRLRFAAGLLLASDFLLAVFAMVWAEPAVHILCRALFTVSLMLMASFHPSDGAGRVPGSSPSAPRILSRANNLL